VVLAELLFRFEEADALVGTLLYGFSPCSGLCVLILTLGGLITVLTTDGLTIVDFVIGFVITARGFGFVTTAVRGLLGLGLVEVGLYEPEGTTVVHDAINDKLAIISIE
jgi:hypothetical protein